MERFLALARGAIESGRMTQAELLTMLDFDEHESGVLARILDRGGWPGPISALIDTVRTVAASERDLRSEPAREHPDGLAQAAGPIQGDLDEGARRHPALQRWLEEHERSTNGDRASQILAAVEDLAALLAQIAEAGRAYEAVSAVLHRVADDTAATRPDEPQHALAALRGRDWASIEEQAAMLLRTVDVLTRNLRRMTLRMQRMPPPAH
jgi:hypothetical protein